MSPIRCNQNQQNSHPGQSWLGRTFEALVTVVLLLTFVSEAPAGDFGFRKSITIGTGKITGGPLSDFPMLVSVTDLDLRTTPSGDVTDAQGDDIIFRALDTTTCDGPSVCTLDHEIEQYDGGSGKLVAWVRVPSINNGTVIYIYYGASTITTSTENVDGVWDSNYQSVYHLKEDPGPGTTDDMEDSSGNNHHATAEAGFVPADLVAAKIGEGIDFDGGG